MANERILVIRLGALGDLVTCFQSFYEIRKAHPDAVIALLTMPGFVTFAKAMPWFNEIIVDERPAGWRIDQWWHLLRRIKTFNPTRVYDLQGKRRQNIIFHLLGGNAAIEWSGAVKGCRFPRLWPPQAHMTFPDFLAAQLRKADVPPAHPAPLSWLDAPLDGLVLPERFAVLIPGCGPGRPYKRWPAIKYAELARLLAARGIASVAVGTKADQDAVDALRAVNPDVIDLIGKTSLMQLGGLARRAACAIGNDSGPTHIMASVGAITLSLMSDRVNAIWSASHGPRAAWLQGKPLETLGTDEVFLALDRMLDTKA